MPFLDVPKEFTKLSGAEQTNVISDFFIMRKFRRKGIGKEVAFYLFKKFRGVWEIKQTLSNKAAAEFWRKIIEEYAGDYTFELLENEKWNGPVLVFQS